MIDRNQFDMIRQRHGGYASWAVWADVAEKPKSNVGDLSILDANRNPTLLETLRNDIVMVGLNISRCLSEAFRNFHDLSPKANDFKIRYAFRGTGFWGAYMTDIIKNVEMVKSASLRRHLRASPSLIQENVETFLQELADLNATRPTILAFGADAHRLMADHVPATRYSRLVKLTHYSHQIGKEQYRQIVLAQIALERNDHGRPKP